jgi:hypothetical protein
MAGFNWNAWPPSEFPADFVGMRSREVLGLLTVEMRTTLPALADHVSIFWSLGALGIIRAYRFPEVINLPLGDVGHTPAWPLIGHQHTR